jgi:hypothetical protein
MTQPWVAEREVSAELALGLVREQFPELGAGGIRPFGSGWDSAGDATEDAALLREGLMGMHHARGRLTRAQRRGTP